MNSKSKILSVLVIALAASVIVRVFVFEGFIVSGNSMEPAIHAGDLVLVNKLSYLWSEPTKGDIVVATPRNMGTKVLKRIVGLPGETVSIDGKRINLDPEEYFVLGDNAAVSIDSRELGPIDKWDIKGRAIGAFSFSRLTFKHF